MAKPVIWTVDDDPDVLRAVERDLRRQYGDRYKVISADSGASALDGVKQLKLRNEPIALFLVDQRMPRMSGVEFLEKAMEFYPDAKRALLTAYADTDAAIRAIHGDPAETAGILDSDMRRAIDEMDRRRVKQLAYNAAHGITARSVEKSIADVMISTSVADAVGHAGADDVQRLMLASDGNAEDLVARLEAEMLAAAKGLEFERAASLRDRIEDVRATLAMAGKMGVGDQPRDTVGTGRGRRGQGGEPRRVKRRFGPAR